MQTADKQRIIGGVIRWVPNGKRSILQKYLLLFREVSALRKQIMWREARLMFPLRQSTMVWTVSSEILIA